MHWVGGGTTEGVLTFKEVASRDGVALSKLAVVVPRRSDVLVIVGHGTNGLGGIAGVAGSLRVRVKDLAVLGRGRNPNNWVRSAKGNERTFSDSSRKCSRTYLTLPPLHMRSSMLAGVPLPWPG